jgi:D-alanine-D-alanine ligase-like ATP-grasp enzyme
MNSPYTTTITDEARRRGIRVKVLDPDLPIFALAHGGRTVRCFNALTDRVGAATFHLAQDKRALNGFLKARGFSVPDQAALGAWPEATAFLKRHGTIVVKPAREWGGRGVSVDIRTEPDLQQAIRTARKFGEDVVLEQCVRGQDYRLIVVDGEYVAAIERTPAAVTGNGHDSIRTLIRKQNTREQRLDKSHRIPLDRETRRTLLAAGLDWDSVPRPGQVVTVRRTTNYHTGGTVRIITDSVTPDLVAEAKRVASELAVPVLGVDFFVDLSGRRHWIIECSPDLAISPPEGETVARAFLDYLFPETRAKGGGYRG